MRRSMIAAVTVLLAASLHAANAPAVQWVRAFSGKGAAEGRWVEQTQDGGFIAVGSTWRRVRFNQPPQDPHEIPYPDIYVVKTDSFGELEWETAVGDTYQEVGFCVQQTRDGGYIASGSSSGASLSRFQPVLVELDQQGAVEWLATLYKDTLERGYSVRECSDGGFVVAATNPSSDSTGFLLVKTDSTGNPEWQRTFLGDYGDEPEGVCAQQTADGGYVLATLPDAAWLTLERTDSLGTALWSRSYRSDRVCDGNWLEPTPDGGCVVTGFGESNTDPDDPAAAYLLKTDSMGNRQWLKTYGGADMDVGFCVALTSDGGFVVAARTTLPASQEGLILRTDAQGNLLWSRGIGGAALRTADARCVRQTQDGGYVVAGSATEASGSSTTQVIYLAKLEADGRR